MVSVLNDLPIMCLTYTRTFNDNIVILQKDSLMIVTENE